MVEVAVYLATKNALLFRSYLPSKYDKHRVSAYHETGSASSVGIVSCFFSVQKHTSRELKRSVKESKNPGALNAESARRLQLIFKLSCFLHN